MAEMRITASFEVNDNQRDQGRIIGLLDDPTKAYEDAIKVATGQDVSIDIRAVRTKAKAATPLVVSRAPE
jgi:hypothetical protein